MLLCCLVITLVIATPIPANAGSACENLKSQAQAWLTSTSWRPVHPEDLKLVPDQSRRAVLSLLPGDVRSNLWREFLESYIADHRELTDDQIRVINTAIDLASPEYFATRPGSGRWTEKVEKPTSELAQRARKAFSSSAFRTIFVNMDKLLESPAPGSTSTPIFACDCNISLGNCTLSGHTGPCQAGSCLTSQRCGTLGTQNCDGQCNFGATTPAPGTDISNP